MFLFKHFQLAGEVSKRDGCHPNLMFQNGISSLKILPGLVET